MKIKILKTNKNAKLNSENGDVSGRAIKVTTSQGSERL